MQGLRTHSVHGDRRLPRRREGEDHPLHAHLGADRAACHDATNRGAVCRRFFVLLVVEDIVKAVQIIPERIVSADVPAPQMFSSFYVFFFLFTFY